MLGPSTCRFNFSTHWHITQSATFTYKVLVFYSLQVWSTYLEHGHVCGHINTTWHPPELECDGSAVFWVLEIKIPIFWLHLSDALCCGWCTKDSLLGWQEEEDGPWWTTPRPSIPLSGSWWSVVKIITITTTLMMMIIIISAPPIWLMTVKEDQHPWPTSPSSLVPIISGWYLDLVGQADVEDDDGQSDQTLPLLLMIRKDGNCQFHEEYGPIYCSEIQCMRTIITRLYRKRKSGQIVMWLRLMVTEKGKEGVTQG